MKLSILIAMYNSCENVEKTLEKLYSQMQKGVEVIVVDDGSTDEWGATYVEVSCIEKGFRYVREENRGEAGARQKGLDLAKGDYFTWVDADDSIVPNYLEIILREIGEYKGVDIITHRWINQDGVLGVRHELPMVNWNVWSNVYRREAVKEVKFDLDRIIASDYFWLEEAVKKCKSFYNSEEVTNIYNDKNPDSLTHQFERGEVKARFSEA